MFPNSYQKSQCTVATQDMPIKKKLLLYIALMCLVILWFLGVRNRDPDRYEAMRQTLNNYEYQLKEERLLVAEKLRMIKKDCQTWDPELPVIYAITPTYARPVQKAELSRLSHTFMLVQNLHWILVEDSDHHTSLVTNFLANTHLNYTHLIAPTPKDWKIKEKEPNWVKPRGVLQRNRAIEWLRQNMNPETSKGVVYFADDDNSYSLEVFQEMRYTKEVSVWPVGLVGGLMVEKPLIDKETGHVTGFNSVWKPERQFPLDMAGFAINLQHLLRHPEAKFQLKVKGGWQETELLRHLTTRERLEPMADNCTKVYVWHTRTEQPKMNEEVKLHLKGQRSDIGMEV